MHCKDGIVLDIKLYLRLISRIKRKTTTLVRQSFNISNKHIVTDMQKKCNEGGDTDGRTKTVI